MSAVLPLAPMGRWRQSSALGLGFGAVLLVGAGCGRCGVAVETAAEPGLARLEAHEDRPFRQLTIGIQQRPDTLWAPFSQMMVAEEILGAGQIALTLFDEEWRVEPGAAVEIPTLENGGLELLDQGRMRTTWTLDADLMWPDGVPVTADDFVFAHQVYSDPSFDVIDRTLASKIASIRAEGPERRKLVVEWKQVYAYYQNYQNHPVLPAHRLGAVFRENSAGLPTHEFGLKPMLPGAFTVSAWVRGSHVILDRNPAARGKRRPWFDRLIFRIIPTSSALEANLVSGTIDAVSPGWLGSDSVERLRVEHGDRFRFHRVEGLRFEHVDFNLENPVLADVRVRRALLYGLDRVGLAQKVFQHPPPVAHSWVPRRRNDHNADVRHYDFDRAHARRLLEEAGYRMGEDGVRIKDGQRLKLSIMTTSGDRTREQIQRYMQEDWQELGVELEVRDQPAAVFFSETLRRRKFPGLALYSWTLDPMHDSSSLWSCEQIPEPSNNWSGQNFPGWCNREVTRVHQEIERTLDSERRRDLLRRQQLLWAEELPVLPLFFRTETSVTVKQLQGWRPTGTLVPVTWNAREWHFQE